MVVYDILRSRWDTPLTYPVEMLNAKPTALAYDRAGNALWLGTDRGDLFTIVPGFAQWDRAVGLVRGAIERIIVAQREFAVYVNAGGEWHRVRAGSLSLDRVPDNALPADVRAQIPPVPQELRAAIGTIGMGPQMQRWQISDVKSADFPGEYWIATQGGGLLKYDRRFERRDWLRYGLAGPGAASIAQIGANIWFGGDGRSQRTGVARADTQLQSWAQYDAVLGAPRGMIAEIVSFAGAIWVASSDGLHRLDPSAQPDRRAWRRFTTREGLPSEQVRALHVFGGLLWAGTDRGLIAFDSAGAPAAGPLLQGRRTSRLATADGAMLIAHDDGLWRITDPASMPVREPGTSYAGRITDVAVLADTVFAVADGRLLRSGLVANDPALERIGSIFRLHAASGRVWVAGPRGIAHRDPVTGSWEAFTTPEDIPVTAPVLDVLPLGDDVWVATPAGAIRLRWR